MYSTMKSEKFSIKGWSFKTWIIKNKKTLKIVIAGVFGYLLPLHPEYQVIGGALCKLLLDTIDFYSNEVNL